MTAIARLAVLCLVLPLVVQLPGCDSSTCPGDDQGPDGSLDPIEGRVLFRVAERHDCPGESCEPSIFLLMQTEKIYGCYNFGIESEVDITGDVVSVSLQGIYKPSICLTALGPALAARALNLAAGSYVLRFSLEDRVDEYEVTVTDEAMAVSVVDADFTGPLTLLTWRYPRESFAYLCGTKTETSWICDAFLDSLLWTGRLGEFEFPDSGDIPYPRASSGHYYDTPARYFQYETEADFDSAGALLASYSREVISQHEGVGIYLVNWRNKWFRSWQLEE